MADRENNRSWRRLRRIWKTLVILFFLVLGGLLFNLDRLDRFGLTLLRYQRLLPTPVRAFLPGASAAAGLPAPLEELRGRIIEVHDGDTATLLTAAVEKTPECKYRIRFYGIDAPELAQRGGVESRDALAGKLLGADVRIYVAAVDHYGRAVGKVKIGERDINLEMVREGQAWYFRDYASDNAELAAAEEHAKSLRIGLWSDESPQPPWEYRRARR